MSPAVEEPRFNIMATKAKIMALFQETHGLEKIRHAHPVPKHSPLFLSQLRSHLSQTDRPRHRLFINAEPQEFSNFPNPVKITHLKPA